MSPARKTFSITEHAGADGAAWLAVDGELDVATVPALHEQLERLRASRVPGVVDLRGATFLGSTGLQCLLSAERQARYEGRRLTLVPGPPEVQRVFELCGALDRLPFLDASGDEPSISPAGATRQAGASGFPPPSTAARRRGGGGRAGTIAQKQHEIRELFARYRNAVPPSGGPSAPSAPTRSGPRPAGGPVSRDATAVGGRP